MQNLPVLDLLVFFFYIAGVVGFGAYFYFRRKDSAGFMIGGGKLPGWAVGLSIFGTYLSSNTFLGIPGKAYGSNWNSFVFSLSLPIAAWVAVKYFVPFYRKYGYISAYHHLEERFGGWARTYAVACFLLIQLARIGSIMFGVSLGLNALLGWDIVWIILVTGILVTAYTLAGGIEAVIWTDVVQSVILLTGAVAILIVLIIDIPGGFVTIMDIGIENHKFNLGSFSPVLTQSTFWVVLLYGFFINLTNFGIDQNFVQRYHTTTSEQKASESIWLAAKMYLPVSLMFFFIGTALYAFYETNPGMLNDVQQNIMPNNTNEGLTASDIGDKVFPHFIVNKLPAGLTGLLIAALFAAAMSTIDSSLNSSATITLTDIYKRFVNPDPDERSAMRILYISTLVWGILGTGMALLLTGVKSILDAWWVLSGIFSGGLLGLFLLGLIVRKAGKPAAVMGVVVGSMVILWMSVSSYIPDSQSYLRIPLHSNMIIVIGTLTIFLVGLALSQYRVKNKFES